MRLILSTRHPRNSTYSTEAGQLLYKVDTSHGLGGSTSTIRKAVATVNGVWQSQDGNLTKSPRDTVNQLEESLLADKYSDEKKQDDHIPDSDRHSIDEAFEDSDDDEGNGGGSSTQGLPKLEGHLAFYAQIQFRTFQSSRFRFDSIETSVSDYFHKEGWSWYGRGRVFKAADGKEYRWELRGSHLEMIRNDGSKTQIARYHSPLVSLGPIMKGRPAILEVDDGCKLILDEIIMTFLYCYKLRKDRKRRQRHSGGGGGP